VSELPIILVAEDDQLLRTFVEETLTDDGFEAVISASGEEAVTLLAREGAKYRAVVTDINLSGEMDGWEVAQRAREIDHAFPVIYMSGAHAEDWAVKGVPNSVMLAKPFAPVQLVTALAQLLNAAPPPITPGT
jgi:DNA-binding response OmpR family regulator